MDLQSTTIIDALSAALEYFESRADADHDETGFVPNEAMRLSAQLSEALRLASIPPSLPSPPIHPPYGDVRDDPRYLAAMSVAYSSQHLAIVTRYGDDYAVLNAARKITGYIPPEIGAAVFAAWQPPERVVSIKSGPPRTRIEVDFEL